MALRLLPLFFLLLFVSLGTQTVPSPFVEFIDRSRILLIAVA